MFIISATTTVDDSMSVCSGSMYEEYDPFEYLHSGSGGASVSAEPIYATITRTDGKVPMSPPPLPPRLSQSTLERKRNTRETWVSFLKFYYMFSSIRIIQECYKKS